MHANTIYKETKTIAVLAVAMLMIVAAAAIVLSPESNADTTEKFSVTVSEVNESGTKNSTYTVPAGKTIRIDADNSNKLYVNVIGITKAVPEDTERYHYEFTGWQYKVTGADDSTLADVTTEGIVIDQDLTVVGDLVITTQQYEVSVEVDDTTPYGTVQWYDSEDNEVENPVTVYYRSEVYTTGNTLYLNDTEADVSYHAVATPADVDVDTADSYYAFGSWDLEVSQITGDLTVTASFEEKSLYVWDPENKVKYKITAIGGTAVRAVGYEEGITSVVIPDTFVAEDGETYKPVSLGVLSFASCDTATTAYIGANVTFIDYGALSGPSFEAFYVDEDNIIYASENGVIYLADMTSLVKFPAAKQRIVIPDTVDTICDYAFGDSNAAYAANKIRYISIPGSVETIGFCAFENTPIECLKFMGCEPLIKDHAFDNCTSLSYVLFPETFSQYSDEAIFDNVEFYDADGAAMDFSVDAMAGHKFTAVDGKLTMYMPPVNGTIVNGDLKYRITSTDDMTVTLMGAATDGLTSVEISSVFSYLGFDWSVTAIASKAFYGNEDITEVYYNDNNASPALVTIGAKAFANCTSLESVDINVGKVNAYAFRGSGLYSIDLSNATYIGAKAFSGCSCLTGVDLSSVEDIGSCAFFGCGLTAADLSSATSIGYKAFAGNALESVQFSADLSNIDPLAFQGYTFTDANGGEIDVSSALAGLAFAGSGKILKQVLL